MRKSEKKCEKFGNFAKNVCDFAKKGMVFAKFGEWVDGLVGGWIDTRCWILDAR